MTILLLFLGPLGPGLRVRLPRDQNEWETSNIKLASNLKKTRTLGEPSPRRAWMFVTL